MKKSKIIIPALAVIAFSTAASITGTVAWFTSNRSATFTAGDFEVVNTNANLSVSTAAGIGTSVASSGDQPRAVSVAAGNKLTHGSFNHSTKNIYTPSADGKSIVKETALASASAANMQVGTNVYTAVTFTFTATIHFGSGGLNTALFLDTTTSAFTITSTDTSANNTATGFRMAFVPTTVPSGSTGATRVWADLQTATNCKYVASLTNYAGTAYTSPDLIDSATSLALPGDNSINQATAAARADYLGTFQYAEDTDVSMTYTVVCWYEGTDPNVVNEKVLQKVQASIKLDAVDLAA